MVAGEGLCGSGRKCHLEGYKKALDKDRAKGQSKHENEKY
jgi:hypothetical protein